MITHVSRYYLKCMKNVLILLYDHGWHSIKHRLATFIFSSSCSLSCSCSCRVSFSVLSWALRSLCVRITSLHFCSRFSCLFTRFCRASISLVGSLLPSPAREIKCRGEKITLHLKRNDSYINFIDKNLMFAKIQIYLYPQWLQAPLLALSKDFVWKSLKHHQFEDRHPLEAQRRQRPPLPVSSTKQPVRKHKNHS